ncbi:hypothetical protein S7335_2490 [Synechococcus sp. PCC 7335]|nr:hypothetical protein S7335_2490 [Synechococcus sp. PCC 7335]
MKRSKNRVLADSLARESKNEKLEVAPGIEMILIRRRTVYRLPNNISELGDTNVYYLVSIR